MYAVLRWCAAADRSPSLPAHLVFDATDVHLGGPAVRRLVDTAMLRAACGQATTTVLRLHGSDAAGERERAALRRAASQLGVTVHVHPMDA